MNLHPAAAGRINHAASDLKQSPLSIRYIDIAKLGNIFFTDQEYAPPRIDINGDNNPENEAPIPPKKAGGR
jgi:hypothetical protein